MKATSKKGAAQMTNGNGWIADAQTGADESINVTAIRYSGSATLENPPVVLDQGNTKASVVFAVLNALAFLQKTTMGFSCLYTYTKARTDKTDSGVSFTDVLSSIANTGVLQNTDLPWDATKVTEDLPSDLPTPVKTLLSYKRIFLRDQTETMRLIRTQIDQNLAVLIGFNVYSDQFILPENFDSPVGGIAGIVIGCDNEGALVLLSNGADSVKISWEYLTDPRVTKDLLVLGV